MIELIISDNKYSFSIFRYPIIALVLLLHISAWADSPLQLKKDTIPFKLISPDTNKEKDLFSDPKLHYNVNMKYEPGMFERFVTWLSDVIFGDVTYDNIILTRRIIMWAVIIFALFIIIKLLMRSNFTKLIKPESKMLSFGFTELTDGLHHIQFDKYISESEAAGDWRAAVRWRYLKTLHLLEKSGLLVFVPAKTNIDYMSDLRSSPYRKDFIELSRIYEYVWYGKFSIEDKSYSGFTKLFQDLYEKIDVQRK